MLKVKYRLEKRIEKKERNNMAAERFFSVNKRKRFLPLIFLLVICYLCVSLSFNLHRLWVLQKEITVVEQEVSELRQRNEELRNQLQKMQDEAYIEQIAREKLGLVKNGETRLVPVTEKKKAQ